ncbi:WecB/TagA/CpsF family glycosyltransferase [Aureimonas sp. N4]|uniref:WecB/TagA/CpsF family glycosyltransferase n=1 Tax=Aureimonas sp. N4 TaxID=1638165 RepID=UPI000783E0EB|nr:WecB/TagA/CpsF family glycosyltransferase [Aureimonas sp. N4]
MISTIDYLGMRFLDANLAGVRSAFREALRGRFGYVVTPNVDHVVSYHRGDAALREVYDGALFQICDSRVLSRLAGLSGLHLTPCPGSDLTRDLLERPLFPAMRIAVIGPDMDAFRDLQQRFPSVSLTLIPSAQRLSIGSPEWKETVARTAGTRWDLLLVCLSFPKQEFFAHDLGRAGRVHGLALCVGASIDFLTGRQKRAPEFFRKAGLEWLHRLAQDPRRMASRYLQRGPAVFALAGREWARLRQEGPMVADRPGSPKRVLFLTTVMPHERMTGGEIASMNFIDGLKASGCEVEVIAYRREGQADDLPVGFLSPVDWPIESAGRPVRSGAWMASAFLARRPYSVQKYVSRAMRRFVRLRLRSVRADLAVIDHAQASWLLPLLPADLPTVLIAHNVEHQLYEGHGDALSGVAKPRLRDRLKARIYRREGERLLAVERKTMARVREVWTLAEDDAAALTRLSPQTPVRSFGLPGQPFLLAAETLPEPTIDVGLLGSWVWDVNRAGLDWFLTAVAPRLPGHVKVVVGGKSLHPPGTVIGSVRFAGFVPDAGAFLRSCSVVVIPSTTGSGVQIKTIETLGLGVPTVATTVALRGIDDPPLDLRLANSATDMVNAILETLQAPRPDGRDGAAWRLARERAFETDIRNALSGLLSPQTSDRTSKDVADRIRSTRQAPPARITEDAA